MVEIPPESGLAAAGSLALWKVLGPSAGEMGEALRRWTEYRLKNVGRISEKAAKKAGANLESPGGVHPGVAHRILEEGSWVDDELMQEYLAGMLVASRSESESDDQGAYLSSIVTRMTANQVKVHCANLQRPAWHRANSRAPPRHGTWQRKLPRFPPFARSSALARDHRSAPDS